MKYELVKDDFKIVDDVIVYRIRAVTDFDDVKAGQLGGYISDESSLVNDLEDRSWIDADSVVISSTLSDTKILRSYIEDCNIKYSYIKYSYIFSSNIEDCKIFGSDIEDGNIKYSKIFASNICKSNIDNSVIDSCNIDHSTLDNCKKDNEVINNEGQEICDDLLAGQKEAMSSKIRDSKWELFSASVISHQQEATIITAETKWRKIENESE